MDLTTENKSTFLKEGWSCFTADCSTNTLKSTANAIKGKKSVIDIHFHNNNNNINNNNNNNSYLTYLFIF